MMEYNQVQVTQPVRQAPFAQEVVDLYNKGTMALQNRNYTKAEKYFKKSIAITPTADALLNLGTCYKHLDMDKLSRATLKEATKDGLFTLETTQSVKAMALNNLGLMEFVRNNDNEAENLFLDACKIWENKTKTKFYDAEWNLSTSVLRKVCSGDYDRWAEGWARYENRFLKSSCVKVNKVFGSIADKIWSGQRDCRIVVAQEQGIGDNIMFARFIPQLEKEFNIKIDLQVDESLGAILRSNGISCPSTIDVRDYDYMLPLGSICRFVTELDSSPYIKFDNGTELPASDRPKIGLVWSGSTTHVNDRHRSLYPGYFKFLTKLGDVYSLNPRALNIPNWVKTLDLPDWSETCSLLNRFDYIVTVDTSLAHMAGAMGVKTFVLMPYKETDFRWGSRNTSDNIWYKSVKVIRNPANWDICIETLKKEINDLKRED